MKDTQKEKISILGCGWLGMPLAVRLIQDGFRVNGSTTTMDKLPMLAAMGIEPHLFNLETPGDEMVRFLDASTLIIMITSKNVAAFERLINHITKSPVRKVLFISSTSVYGSSNENISEEAEVLPTPLAGIEHIFFSNRHFQTTIVRFGGLFGYERKPGRFFRSGKKVKDPENVVNLIHRDDCIGIIEMIIRKQIWGEIFNGTSDSHPTKREFYTKASLDIGQEPPEFESGGLVLKKWVSNEKVKTLLGYVFKYPDLMNIRFD